ncbi:unnamed protein product [Bemisia tabaci]|uniref:Uncharacterized protein n=1 Tax=Bemisia tabaci TaxID=7038 RepID=A0A9P0A3W6_BEMTA|nr:unnamed protein product [Bemisia tabaci]
MRFRIYCVIINVSIVLPNEVYSDGACGRGTPDLPSCEVQCNSAWGRDSLYNLPWTRASCSKGDCVCQFNLEDVRPFMGRYNYYRTLWTRSLKGKVKIARQELKNKISKMSVDKQFAIFQETYNKNYGSEEERKKRFKIFKKNLVEIKELMASEGSGGSVVYGVGPFTDFTREEYLNIKGIVEAESDEEPGESQSPRLRPRMLFRQPSTSSSDAASSSDDDVRGRSRSAPPSPRKRSRPGRRSLSPNWKPSYFTYWIDQNAPSGRPIKDWRVPAASYPPTDSQNQQNKLCNSCWAIAAAGAVEILLSQAAKTPIKISTQALVDCVPGPSKGCLGGDVEQALTYLEQFGVPKAADYPYKAVTGVCDRSKTVYANIRSFAEVREEDVEDALQISPIPTNMYWPPQLQHYVSGVLNSDGCLKNWRTGGHAVVIVGHYRGEWIIRDSSPSSWGLQGHMLVKKGICAIGLRNFKITGATTKTSAPVRKMRTLTMGPPQKQPSMKMGSQKFRLY